MRCLTIELTIEEECLQKTRENFSRLCPRCCLDTEFRMRTLEEEVLWVKDWLGKAVHYGGIPAVAGQ